MGRQSGRKNSGDIDRFVIVINNIKMTLSIITINYNNALGLAKTLKSVLNQTCIAFEHIIVDGASNDNAVEIIQQYEKDATARGIKVVWVSEKDKGIYNAMNKGIKMANGEYCEFLNSGDMLAGDDVVKTMYSYLEENKYPDVMYGNMQKVLPNGKKNLDRCYATNDVTLNMFYRGCLNHSPAYIRRRLFDIYGFYDETLKICSDWKFYMQSIVLGKATVKYVNCLVTIFDMNGISETRKDILNEERNKLLEELVPTGILKDYHNYHFAMSQYDRLKRHHIWSLVYFVERVLFKLEKWHIL